MEVVSDLSGYFSYYVALHEPEAPDEVDYAVDVAVGDHLYENQFSVSNFTNSKFVKIYLYYLEMRHGNMGQHHGSARDKG